MSAPRKEAALAAATPLRWLLAWGLIASYRQPFINSVGWVAAIIATDILDGKVARLFQADGHLRRIADVVVDRTSVTSAFIAVFVIRPEYRHVLVLSSWVFLSGVKLLYSCVGTWSYLRYKVMIRGMGSHKIFSLSQAALGLIMVYGVNPLVLPPLVIGLAAYNLRFALDFLDRYRTVIKTEYRGNQTLVIMESRYFIDGRRTLSRTTST